MPVTMETRRRLQPYHVRFPMRTARSYKFMPGLTERCKALVGQLKVAFSHTAPSPVSRSLIPLSVQRRLYGKHGFTLINCSHCGRLEVRYTDANASFSSGICRTCAPAFTRTQDGLVMLTAACYRGDDGSLWSSEEAYEEQRRSYWDDDDYDESDSDNSVAEYHCHPDRSSKMRYHEPNSDDHWAKDVIHIGFEWEYNSVSRDVRAQDARALDDTTYCFGEEDGSLSSYRGLEVVTGWSTLGTVCAWAKDIRDRIRIGDIEDAGLHVNISGLTNLQLAKLITFLSHNFQLTTRIGGRSSSYYAAQQSVHLRDWLYKTRRYGSSTLGSSAPSTDKYSTCNIRRSGKVAEIRIFNSAKSAESVVQRIQYAWLAAQFVRQPGLDLSERNFKQFLADNPWAVRGARDLLKAFPDLCPTAFAKRPKKVPA